MIGQRRPRLRRDDQGATIIEFAMILPVMLILIMGLSELAYRAYLQSILLGAMQKAGRDSTIQGASAQSTAIDAKVMAVVWKAAAKATYVSSRKSYSTFSNAAPEPFVDSNNNGKYDKGECFSDINGNGVWDSDPGVAGQGGANDITIYTMNVTYPHLFPLGGWLGWSSTQAIQATTILKNQPYATQTVVTPVTICT